MSLYLTPFATVFPEQGMKETRVITTCGYPRLPDDEYALIEAYCADPKCDCRRVMLNVVGRRQGDKYLASVSFGFDRDEEMAGPFLDPLNPHSQYADVLLPLVEQALTDPAYVARLESHYRQIKWAAHDHKDPAHETIRRIRQDERRWEMALDRKLFGATRAAPSTKSKKRQSK
jgi:hypothetical protein